MARNFILRTVPMLAPCHCETASYEYCMYDIYNMTPVFFYCMYMKCFCFRSFNLENWSLRLNHKSLDFKFSFHDVAFRRICDFHIRFVNNNFINIGHALCASILLSRLQPEYICRLSSISIQFQPKAKFKQSISSD